MSFKSQSVIQSKKKIVYYKILILRYTSILCNTIEKTRYKFYENLILNRNPKRHKS